MPKFKELVLTTIVCTTLVSKLVKSEGVIQYCEKSSECTDISLYCSSISGLCEECVAFPCQQLFMDQNGDVMCERQCPKYYLEVVHVKRYQSVTSEKTQAGVPRTPAKHQGIVEPEQGDVKKGAPSWVIVTLSVFGAFVVLGVISIGILFAKTGIFDRIKTCIINNIITPRTSVEAQYGADVETGLHEEQQLCVGGN